MVTRDLIIFKNIFLTVCVSLSGLGPSETHEKLSMRKMCDSSNEKQGEKLFLLWRHSALLVRVYVRPFSWLAKNRRQGNPCQYRRKRLVDTLRCALPLQAPLTCTSRLSCLSSDRRESHWKRNLRQREVLSTLSLSLSLSLSFSPSLSLNNFIEIAKDQETKRQRAGREKQEYSLRVEGNKKKGRRKSQMEEAQLVTDPLKVRTN